MHSLLKTNTHTWYIQTLSFALNSMKSPFWYSVGLIWLLNIMISSSDRYQQQSVIWTLQSSRPEQRLKEVPQPWWGWVNRKAYSAEWLSLLLIVSDFRDGMVELEQSPSRTQWLSYTHLFQKDGKFFVNLLNNRKWIQELI